MGGGSAHLLPRHPSTKACCSLFWGREERKVTNDVSTEGREVFLRAPLRRERKRGMREGGSHLRLFWNFLASDFPLLCRADKVKEWAKCRESGACAMRGGAAYKKGGRGSSKWSKSPTDIKFCLDRETECFPTVGTFFENADPGRGTKAENNRPLPLLLLRHKRVRGG